ncbi:MAG: ATP-binding protein [Anaerolineales bacterium]
MSLRARLILGYSTVLIAVLMLFGISIYFVLQYTLTQQIDQALGESADTLRNSIAIQSVEDLKLLILAPLPFSSSNAYVQIWDAYGNLLVSSPNLQGVNEPLASRALPILQPEFTDNRIRGVHLRVISKPILIGSVYAGQLEVGIPLTVVDRAQYILLLMLLIGSALAVLLSILLGNGIVRSALRPIDAVTTTALQITLADDLSRRIPLEVPAGSEVGRLIQAFNETLERLEKLFTAQSRFLADVSHELRTPLTSIRGNVDLIRRMGPDSESLDAVQSEVDRMIRLVGDLLLLSRAEAGTLPLSKTPVEIDTLLLEVFQQALVLTQGKVQVSIGNLEQAVVIGDRDRLKQLLLNLVVNALQYTQSGGRVLLSLRGVDDFVHITISDNGPGIPPEELPHIFDRFYRVEKSRSRSALGGSGLGLSIAQWIAQSHDGRIEVASEPGKGTTFSVWLPLKKE